MAELLAGRPGDMVVIIACVIVGTYLYAADQVFKPFVRNVLLGQ